MGGGGAAGAIAGRAPTVRASSCHDPDGTTITLKSASSLAAISTEMTDCPRRANRTSSASTCVGVTEPCVCVPMACVEQEGCAAAKHQRASVWGRATGCYPGARPRRSRALVRNREGRPSWHERQKKAETPTRRTHPSFALEAAHNFAAEGAFAAIDKDYRGQVGEPGRTRHERSGRRRTGRVLKIMQKKSSEKSSYYSQGAAKSFCGRGAAVCWRRRACRLAMSWRCGAGDLSHWPRTTTNAPATCLTTIQSDGYRQYATHRLARTHHPTQPRSNAQATV